LEFTSELERTSRPDSFPEALAKVVAAEHYEPWHDRLLGPWSGTLGGNLVATLGLFLPAPS
jgi:hypothetical protein